MNLVSQTSKKEMDILATENAIFKLNEDCIAKIFSYLPWYQGHSLVEIDQRFRSSALIHFCRGGLKVIDQHFLKSFPLDIEEGFYQSHGAGVVQMEFRTLSESDFSKVLHHYPNLRKLVLSNINVSSFQPLPTTLTTLELENCSIAENVLLKWFTQINGTLTELSLVRYGEERDANQPTYESLKKLNNLTSLSINGSFPEDPVRKLISRNKLTLRKLDLSPGGHEGQDPLPEAIWNVVSKLKHLEELRLCHQSLNYKVRIHARSKFWPGLTSLELQLKNPYDIVKQLACKSTLISLTLWGVDDNPNPVFYSFYPNLRHLHLPYINWLGNPVPKTLCSLQQLHSIRLNGGLFDTQGMMDLMEIEKELPNLKKLDLAGINLWRAGNCEAKEMEAELKLVFGRRDPPFEFRVSVCAM